MKCERRIEKADCPRRNEGDYGSNRVSIGIGKMEKIAVMFVVSVLRSGTGT